MGGVASAVDSDGRRLTRGSGFWLVNKACSVVPVFLLLWTGYSTVVAAGRRHVGPPGCSQSCVSLRSNGVPERKAANQRRTRLR
uniref:Uncharacterized protein n=1 Tax=Mesocestoides corti TaxID=53468 RepID=A0A5K3EW93_MESCO